MNLDLGLRNYTLFEVPAFGRRSELSWLGKGGQLAQDTLVRQLDSHIAQTLDVIHDLKTDVYAPFTPNQMLSQLLPRTDLLLTDVLYLQRTLHALIAQSLSSTQVSSESFSETSMGEEQQELGLNF